MYSAQLLKAAVNEAMLNSFLSGNLLYFPLGAQMTAFAIADDFPQSQADFTQNRATLTVSGPTSGIYSNHSTYASSVLTFTSHAATQPDAAFLAEYLADWVMRLSGAEMPMQGQVLEWINIVRAPVPARNRKNQLWFSSFDAEFKLHVVPRDESPPHAQIV